MAQMTPEERYAHLRDFGPKAATDLKLNEDGKPDWFDEARFAAAKRAVAKYRLGIQYSSLTGLVLILQLPEGLEPLLSTGNSKDIPSLFKRYLSTIVHVSSWYDDDVFDPQTKGYKSIRQVRAMHKRVQQLMNERFEVADAAGKPRIWFNQYDVALTQFAFIGLAMIYPQKCAMIAASAHELELVNYYWRVLGWLMGCRDEFNACSLDRYEHVRQFNRLILEHEFKAKFDQSACPLGLKMTEAICVALQHYAPLVSFNALAHWWQDCFMFNGYKLRPLSARDRVIIGWTKLSFNRLLKSTSVLRVATKLHKLKFERRLKDRQQVLDKLKTKHANDTDNVFVSDRVDYFAKLGAGAAATIELPDDTGSAGSRQRRSDSDSGNDEQMSTSDSTSDRTNDKSTTVFESACPFAFKTELPSVLVTSHAQTQNTVCVR